MGVMAVALMMAIMVLTSVAEAKRFTIAKFSLQTTRPIKVQGPLSDSNYGFVNEPYSFTQAGGHPAGLTYIGEFENETIETPSGPGPVPTRDPKDISTALPPGLLGNPTAVPTCPLKEALAGSYPCPAGTQVGEAALYLGHGEGLVGPIVDVTPEAGQSAEFAIETDHNLSFLLTVHLVRTPEGYGILVEDNGIPNVELIRAELTFWGVPAAAINNPERGLFCGRVDSSSSNSGWECGVSSAGVSNKEL